MTRAGAAAAGAMGSLVSATLVAAWLPPQESLAPAGVAVLLAFVGLLGRALRERRLAAVAAAATLPGVLVMMLLAAEWLRGPMFETVDFGEVVPRGAGPDLSGLWWVLAGPATAVFAGAIAAVAAALAAPHAGRRAARVAFAASAALLAVAVALLALGVRRASRLPAPADYVASLPVVDVPVVHRPSTGPGSWDTIAVVFDGGRRWEGHGCSTLGWSDGTPWTPPPMGTVEMHRLMETPEAGGTLRVRRDASHDLWIVECGTSASSMQVAHVFVSTESMPTVANLGSSLSPPRPWLVACAVALIPAAWAFALGMRARRRARGLRAWVDGVHLGSGRVELEGSVVQVAAATGLPEGPVAVLPGGRAEAAGYRATASAGDARAAAGTRAALLDEAYADEAGMFVVAAACAFAGAAPLLVGLLAGLL